MVGGLFIILTFMNSRCLIMLVHQDNGQGLGACNRQVIWSQQPNFFCTFKMELKKFITFGPSKIHLFLFGFTEKQKSESRVGSSPKSTFDFMQVLVHLKPKVQSQG